VETELLAKIFPSERETASGRWEGGFMGGVGARTGGVEPVLDVWVFWSRRVVRSSRGSSEGRAEDRRGVGVEGGEGVRSSMGRVGRGGGEGLGSEGWRTRLGGDGRGARRTASAGTGTEMTLCSMDGGEICISSGSSWRDEFRGTGGD
jgi:hypothetical protein